MKLHPANKAEVNLLELCVILIIGAAIAYPAFRTFHSFRSLQNVDRDWNTWSTTIKGIANGETEIPTDIFYDNEDNKRAHAIANAILVTAQSEKEDPEQIFLSALQPLTTYPHLNLYNLKDTSLPQQIAEKEITRRKDAALLKNWIEKLKADPTDPAIQITCEGDYFLFTKQETETIMGRNIAVTPTIIPIKKSAVPSLEKATGFSFNNNSKTQIAKNP